MKRNVWLAGAATAAAAGFLWAAPLQGWAAEPIPEGVYVGNVSLAGLSEEEANQKISDYANEKINQTITLVVQDQEAEAPAADLGLSWTNQEEVCQALKETEVTGNLIKRYMKKKDLQVNPVKLELNMDLDQEKVSAFVSEKCGAAVSEAADASITRKNGKFVITPEVIGRTVDIEATKAALNEAFNGEGGGSIVVHAEITEQEPRIKASDLESIQDVLGTFSTDFSSSGASRSTNLQVGAAKINGSILMPGDVLSGYECMHPFTTANGYRAATAYENGRSVDSIGGGVCQISTTLYNAALLAEMEIVQRQNHSMTVGYVKPSMDAAIAGTYKDLKFKNSYDTPVYVEGYTSGRTLTFTIYGKETRPENRTIKFESETLRWMDPGAPTEQVDPSLQPGQRVRVQSSHTGLQSRLFKCVYVDGELQERTLLHNDTYNASKAIYRVGPAAPAAATAPSETEAAPTETTAPTAPVETPAETPAENTNLLGPGYEGPGAETPAPTAAPSPGPAAPAETPAPAPATTPAEAPGAPGAEAPEAGPGM